MSTVLPSGLYATAYDQALVCEWGTDRPAGGGVPLPCRAVATSGEHGLAVMAISHGVDDRLMHQGGSDRRPVAASQSRAVRSELPVSTVLPSGLNATALTAAWCFKRRADRVAGSVSQIRAEPSALPVITVLPSGRNATVVNDGLMRQGPADQGTGRRRRPRARAVPSPPTVSTVLPSGLYARSLTRALIRRRRADRRAGGGVPQPRRLVGAAGQHGLAIGAIRHGIDRTLMRQRRADRCAGGGVPQPRRLVGAAGQARSCHRGYTPRLETRLVCVKFHARRVAGGGVPLPRRQVVRSW